jgi:hypothetical protein
MLLRPKLLCAIGDACIKNSVLHSKLQKPMPSFLKLISSPLLELNIQKTAGRGKKLHDGDYRLRFVAGIATHFGSLRVNSPR